MMKYIRHMLVFSRIVELGSISAAASDLGISKSVLSQQLKTLEQELGVLLLKRTTRQQVLTPVGRDFYQQCQQINVLANQAWDNARYAQQEPSGTLSISAPHALIEAVISPAIGSLVSRFNKIIPSIYASDQRVDLIDDNIDIAIRVGELPSSDYKQQLLGSFREVLCASPQYIQRENLSVGQLKSNPEKLLACDYVANRWQGKSVSHTLTDNSSGKTIELVFKPNRFNDSLNAVIAMVKSGAGIALVPDFIFSPSKHKGELLDIFPDFLLPAVPVYAVHAFGGQTPLNVKLAVDAVKKQMKQAVNFP
ncbi:LysR family transcriptional regulator [Thalassomonas sp. RHCl1]|uniref:LysR family transcriptional regulator n=1 Tax=Thalassomonas sp. RHCl1 TaxID=2995320 RepID=UPI00248B28DD|nr:LysR family transcriptional regulator [Thalassomonas sp. RHCl1]